MKLTRLNVKFCLAIFSVIALAGLPGHSWGVSYTFSEFTVGIPDSGFITPFGISNDGTVVGRTENAAFIQQKNAPAISLGSGNGWTASSAAYGVSSDSGKVVGFYNGASAMGSFIYQGSASTLSLGFTVTPEAGARGVNIYGTIVGYKAIGSPTVDYESFVRTSGGSITWLSFDGWSDLQAYAINNSGTIVGQGKYNGSNQAFVYNGSTIAALAVAGITDAQATGINNSGQIVGFGNEGAFLCDNGTCTVISANGWSNLQVWGINDAKTIVGVGDQGAFTGTPVAPVPLPAPLLLLSSGLAFVAGLRRKYRK